MEKYRPEKTPYLDTFHVVNESNSDSSSIKSEKKQQEGRNKTQTGILNIWKDNIGSLQSTRSNEVWNRIEDEAGRSSEEFVTVQKQNQKFNRSLQKATENHKQIGRSPEFPAHYTEFNEVLGCRDVMKIPNFQHVVVETDCNNESPTFDE